MEFTTVEFNVILTALNERIIHLRKQVSFAEQHLEKYQDNDEMTTLIEKTLIRERQELNDAETTRLKFLKS